VAGPVVAGLVVGDPNFGVDGSDVAGVGGPVVSSRPVVASSASACTASGVNCCAAAFAAGAGGGSLRFMMAIAGEGNSLS
jgi:hypothetical protein